MTSLPKDALKGVSSTKDVIEGVSDLVELTGAEKLSKPLSDIKTVVGNAEKVLNLSQYTLIKGSQLAGQLSSGHVLGALSGLLGISSPTGLQFTLETVTLPPSTFSVVSFELREHYSEPYCLTVQLSSPLDAIEASQVLDQKVKFTVWQSGKAERVISGIVSSFTQGDSGFEQTHYFLEIRPALWRTGLRRNARIFQQKNLQQILTALLNEHGIAHYAFAFTDAHPVREFCVQWQETDFDFIQRLTAEEGIFYYFEEKEGIETLVFSDNAETLSSPLAYPYNPNKTAQLQEQTVGQFLKRTQVRHSRAVLKDYTFKKPDWEAQFEQSATEGERQGYEHYDYPGRFKGSEQGKAFTRYRLESLRRDAHLGEGESNIPGLSPGRLLTLSQHPNPAFNSTWQVISVVSRGEQPQSVEGEAGEKGTYFTNHFQAIPKYQAWRPLQRTKPKVDGPQIAQVVGPKGEEIFTDNVGRIRVQFFWDREGKYDDHSSCWIRVTQPWAGQGWGVLAIPRVGQEVLVDFLDGDPDQPIITGRTYHATNVPPGKLPQSKTQMAFRSKTYKGEGYNELLFEDAPGQEQLNLHAQRDMNTVVLNDRNTIVLNRHQEIIKKNQNITVQGERNKTIHENEMTSVLGRADTFVEKSTTKQVKKDLVISSQNGSITFSVGNSIISLNNEGTLRIESDEVKIDGGKVFFNQYTVAPFATNAVQDSALISSEDSTISNTNLEEMEDAVLAAYLSDEVYRDRGEGFSDKFKQKYPDVEEVSDEELEQLNIDPIMLEHKESGFQANIYKKGDKYFLTYRGTESLKDAKADVDGVVGKMNPQFERAKDLSRKLQNNLPLNSQMVITGHSLGGELASIGALATGVPTYTYNSAGLHPKIIQELKLNPENERSIMAFYTNKDELSLLQDNRINAAKAVLATKVVASQSYMGVEAISNAIFDHSITNIALGVLKGDNLPQAIGNRVKLDTNTGHTISATKEIEREIRKYYGK